MAALTDDLRRVFDEEPTGLFDLDILIHRTDATSIEDVVLAVDALIREGLVRRLVKVNSPSTGIGIQPYYSSILDVPERLLDTTTGEEIDVEPRLVRQLFQHA